MKHITLYNKISNKGLDLFNEEYTVDEDVNNSDAILVRSTKLHDMKFDSSLKAIARAGAGTNNIPIDACSAQGIVVFNTPGANANAVKELVVAGMLLSARPTYAAMNWLQTVKDEDNIADLAEKEKSKYIGSELQGKVLGVIGLGAIGIKIANLALHFGMEVYGFDPYLSVQSAWQLSRNVHLVKNVDDVYRNCDFITIHVPYMEDTKHMIDVVALAKMKDGVRVLNFARDGLVDEDAMCRALDEGKVAHYITDFASKQVMHQKGVICMPHLGASTPEAEENCAVMAVNQLRDYLEHGNITNAVNMPNVSLERSGAARITCVHRNAPSLLAKISQTISSAGLNIENMINKSKNDLAYTMVDVDKTDVAAVVDTLRDIDAILKVQVYV